MRLKHRYLLWKMEVWAAISLWAQRRHFATMEQIIGQAKFEIQDMKAAHFDLGAESVTRDEETAIH